MWAVTSSFVIFEIRMFALHQRPLKKISPRCLFLVLLLCAFVNPIHSQPPVFKLQSYIETYSPEAVHQMVNYKIPASVIMAQAIFESGSGSSELALKSNNHFGIKCHVEWGGETILKDDDTLNECFRRYANIEESFTDHSLFLNSRARYADLFNLPINDYKGWCNGLKAAGYATYPAYAEELIRLIEQAKLYELDGCVNLEILGTDYFFNRLEIIPSDYSPDFFTATEMYNAGILWEDEKEFLIQSLRFIKAEETEEEDTEEDGVTEDLCDTLAGQ
jgi:hypothetical protein